jgi:hypothetical protein
MPPSPCASHDVQTMKITGKITVQFQWMAVGGMGGH